MEGSDLYKGLQARNDILARKFFKCGGGCEAWTLMGLDGKPMGQLANVALRAKRRRAHQAIEPIWRMSMANGLDECSAKRGAYQWLQSALGITFEHGLINSFDDELCDRSIAVCNEMVSVLKGS